MALPAGLHTLVPCSLLSSLFRLAREPASWLTTFIDEAEEIWVDDPFLSDDDLTPPAWPARAPAPVGAHAT